MRLHPNATLTPAARELLARRVREEQWSVAEAARAAGVSRQTAYKWLNRFEEDGRAGLPDKQRKATAFSSPLPVGIQMQVPCQK